MAARFTATFDLRFIDRGAANYLTSLRKTETAQSKVARATKLAAGVGVTAAKATQTQATAAKAATVSTEALAAAQSKASLATKTAAAASANQATELYRQASAIKVVDAATAKLRRETLSAAKASSAAAVALGAQDKAAMKAATSTGTLARSGRDADRAFMGAAGRIGDFAKRAGGLGVIVGAAGLGLAFKSALGAAADFDTALREVGAVSDTQGAKLQALGKISRQAGLETGVGATEATKAMAELAKAGLTAAQIGPALKGTLQLAQAGGLETADAASAAANAMNAFGLEASDTTKIADAFANAANMTTADVGDFAMALAQGGSAAKLAGLSFEDTTLILAELAKIGVKNSDAGTSLKSAFLQLANPTAKAASAMKKYGLEFFRANGEVKDAGDISQMLRDKLGGLNKQQQTATLQTIAGTDGFRTLAAMMSVTGKQSDTMRAQLLKQGSAADTAKAKQGGYAGAMARLKASFEEVKIAVGTPLLGALAKAGDAVSRLVNKVSQAGTFGKIGRGVGDFIAGLGGAPKATSQVVRNGGRGQARMEVVAAPKQTGAGKAGSAVGAVGAAVGKGVAAAAKVASDAFAKLRPQVAAFVKDVGPFWTNVLKPFLQGFGQGLLSTAKIVLTVGVAAFRVLGKALGLLGTVAGKLGLDKVFRAIGTVISWFAGGPIAKALGAAIKATSTFGRLASVVRFVAAPFRAAGSAALKIGGTLLKVASWVAGKATAPYRALGRTVLGMGKNVGGAVASAAAAVARFASRVGSAIGKAIAFFRSLPGKAASAVKGLGSKLGGMAGSVASGAARIGKGIVDGIVNAIKAAPGAIISALTSTLKSAWDGAKGAANAILPGDPFRTGGKVRGYISGGQVAPVNLASGELLAFPGGGTAMVPGGVSTYDNVSTAVPVGTRVFTTHGQDLMAAGMSPTMALARQSPNGYVKGGVVKGRVSVFGPPLERAGTTANGMSSSAAGIALNMIPGTEAGWNNSTTNKWVKARQKFLVKIGSHSAVLPMIDKGPAASTRRAIDVTGAGARKLGFNPASFPTDKQGTATIVGKGGVAAARRRRREGTDDTTVSVTDIKNYPKVKRRGGLMDPGAAARAGYDAALAGDTFKGYRRNGDPFLEDLRTSYSEAVASRISKRDVTVPGTDKRDGVTARAGMMNLPDGVGKGTRLGRMIAKANAIDAKQYQYAWGGGHGRIGVPSRGSLHAHGRGPVGLGFDCSGAVSAVLGAGKMLSRPLTSGALMNWGAKGGSRNLGVVADAGHTIMRIRNRWFGTGGQNPKGGAGWLKGNTMKGRGVTRHWPGLRRGGSVRGYVGGGTVQAGRSSIGPALPVVTRQPAAVGLTPRLRSRIMGLGLEKLDEAIGRLATARLSALYRDIAKLAAKGGSPKVVNRLRVTMDLIDRRLGYRAGQFAARAAATQSAMDASAKGVDWAMRTAGIDSGSPEGIQAARAALKDDQVRIESQRADISKGIAVAKRMGPRGKDILAELRSRLGELQDAASEAAVRQVELAREAVVANANQRSDAAQRATDKVSAGLAMNEAAQRVARTSDTAAGMAQRAAMQQALAPALEAQAAVERQNAAALAAIGKNAEAQDALARAAALSTDALNAVADAAELARQAQMKAVTDRIEATNFDASIADVIGDRYQLQGRLMGSGDPALAQQRAEYFSTTVLPLLQRQESDLANAVATAASQGDTEAERQYRLELEQKRNEILERSLQVQEDIKSNTANRSFGGSLAYEFGGGVFTDLVIDGNGA